jgi:hypothetical protein
MVLVGDFGAGVRTGDLGELPIFSQGKGEVVPPVLSRVLATQDLWEGPEQNTKVNSH